MLTGISLVVAEMCPPSRWLSDELAIAPKTAMPARCPSTARTHWCL